MNAFKKKVMRYSAGLIDMVLPPRCIVSGEEVDHQGMIAPQIWSKLDFIIAPFCDKCGIPFDFDTGGGDHLCANCIQKAPEYDSCRSALRYNDASRDLILGFKHADKTHAVLAFMPWLKTAGHEMLKDADLIVPVPLHRMRLISRRYNQAAIIAHYLGKEMGIDVCVDGLHRIRNTASQGHLKAGERYKNVRRAFQINPKHQNNIAGKNIVLIDDVYTTGSTVNECAKVLYKAGALKVDILSLARVTKE